MSRYQGMVKFYVNRREFNQYLMSALARESTVKPEAYPSGGLSLAARYSLQRSLVKRSVVYTIALQSFR
ncbi:hypothetical protein ACFQUU_24155 [Herbaspirillum sp. GCM10030257]|uniref:hypothetical protein n=1 Tax=Herbaspirillum sp. GCM10030257 TaxID=3273393 RepID=UPI00360CECFC